MGLIFPCFFSHTQNGWDAKAPPVSTYLVCKSLLSLFPTASMNQHCFTPVKALIEERRPPDRPISSSLEMDSLRCLLASRAAYADVELPPKHVGNHGQLYEEKKWESRRGMVEMSCNALYSIFFSFFSSWHDCVFLSCKSSGAGSGDTQRANEKSGGVREKCSQKGEIINASKEGENSQGSLKSLFFCCCLPPFFIFSWPTPAKCWRRVFSASHWKPLRQHIAV